MFNNIVELVALAEERGVKIYELMIELECAESGLSEEAVLDRMNEQYQVMKRAVVRGIEGVTSHSGYTGGDAKRLIDYTRRGQVLTDSAFLHAMTYAVATNEVNAAMGVICATPTAGSSGVVPGVMIAMQEKFSIPDEVVVKHLFTAGAFGYVIANNAFISGAAGGCQAEIGSAAAMAAGALVEMMGGSPAQSADAMALALKNMLGLTCDPLGGLVEVPCIKRNGAGTSIALMAAEMAMAGVTTKVPWDEVIDSMYRIGQQMHVTLRETALGGLATTPTGMRWKEELKSE